MDQSSAFSTFLRRHLAWAVILTEFSHVLCCVLPTIVTLLSLVSSLGVAIQVPSVISDLHEALHAYERPIIVFSAAMLMLGWALYALSRWVECQKTHCEPHETVCAPQKNNTHTVLIVASVLFALNVMIYFTIHVHLDAWMHAQGH